MERTFAAKKKKLRGRFEGNVLHVGYNLGHELVVLQRLSTATGYFYDAAGSTECGRATTVPRTKE